MANTAMTPIGVLYFPALFEPKVNKEAPAQGARFSAVILFDANGVASSAYRDLRAAVKTAIEDKFGTSKANDANFLRGLRTPFRPASDKTYGGFEDGEIFISAWSRGTDPAPGILNLRGERMSVPSDVWGGQLARMTVRPFAYDTQGNKGVSFALEHVQIVKADEPRRDGKQSAEDAFKGGTDDADMQAQMAAMGIKASASAPASGGADDDLPF